MKKANIIFLGGFPFPKGMAVTRHVQLLIKGLQACSGASVRVVVLRQSSQENVLSGSYEGTPYETVIGDAGRAKAILMAPLLHAKARRAIRRLRQTDQTNILFVFGPPSPENLPTVRYARQLQYKVVFYVVEDDDLAWGISASPWHRIGNLLVRRATSKILYVADAVLVISSHLEAKFRSLTHDSLPIYYQPITVDMDCYPDAPHRLGTSVTLFYCGSFGLKDGIPVLLDAFDMLAAKDPGIHLTLTGKGDNEAMREVLPRISASPYRNRIDYRGYLCDDAYRAALNAADILCMTRIGSGFANAGFPFKLGEYLATGKPVIASRVSDVGRLLTDRHDAMLVEPGDSRGIAEAAEYLMNNRDEATIIGRRGRALADSLFDYRRQGQMLFGLLGSF